MFKVGDVVKVNDHGDLLFTIIRDDGDYNFNLCVEHARGARFWRSKEDLTLVQHKNIRRGGRQPNPY